MSRISIISRLQDGNAVLRLEELTALLTMTQGVKMSLLDPDDDNKVTQTELESLMHMIADFGCGLGGGNTPVCPTRASMCAFIAEQDLHDFEQQRQPKSGNLYESSSTTQGWIRAAEHARASAVEEVKAEDQVEAAEEARVTGDARVAREARVAEEARAAQLLGMKETVVKRVEETARRAAEASTRARGFEHHQGSKEVAAREEAAREAAAQEAAARQAAVLEAAAREAAVWEVSARKAAAREEAAREAAAGEAAAEEAAAREAEAREAAAREAAAREAAAREATAQEVAAHRKRLERESLRVKQRLIKVHYMQGIISNQQPARSKTRMQ